MNIKPTVIGTGHFEEIAVESFVSGVLERTVLRLRPRD
jgi:hypothetical protein